MCTGKLGPRHMPARHVLEYVLGHMLWSVPNHMLHMQMLTRTVPKHVLGHFVRCS